MLAGIPVHICQWADKPRYIPGIGLIVRDQQQLDDVLHWANTVYVGREKLGDRCVKELMELYATWKASPVVSPPRQTAGGGGRE